MLLTTLLLLLIIIITVLLLLLLRYFGKYPAIGSAAVTAGAHGVSSRKCRLEAVEQAWTETLCLRSSNHVLFLEKMNTYIHQ